MKDELLMQKFKKLENQGELDNYMQEKRERTDKRIKRELYNIQTKRIAKRYWFIQLI